MTEPHNVMQGIADDGADDAASSRARFLANVRERQETVWAMLCHGRVVVDEAWIADGPGYWRLQRLGIYLPGEHYDFYRSETELGDDAVDRTLAFAI